MPTRANKNDPAVPLEHLLIAFRLLSSPGGASTADVQRALGLASAEPAQRVVRQVRRAMRRQPPGSLPRDHATTGGSRRHGRSVDRPAKGETARGDTLPSHARGKPGTARKGEQDVPPVGEWYAPHRS